VALLDAEKKLELPPKEKETRPRLVMKEKEIEIETQRFWVLDVSESGSAGLTQVNNVVAVPICVCSDLRCGCATKAWTRTPWHRTLACLVSPVLSSPYDSQI